jgi:hypothetical protein
MKKFLTAPVGFFRLPVALAVALCVVFVAIQARAQDGTKLDSPVSAQAPAPGRSLAPASAMKASILKKAAVAYYILQSHGLKSFQCDVQPNWAQIVTDPDQLAAVNQVEFSAVIDDQGGVQVAPFLPSGATIDPSLGQIVGGLQQTISGFFQTWNSFVLSPLIPQPDDTAIGFSSQADGYHFGKQSQNMSVDLVVTKDALLTEMKVVTPSETVVLKPGYIATDNGLLLISTASDLNNGSQKVDFQLQYQEVHGFEMPVMAAYQVTLPNQVVSIDLSLTDYKIVKQ